MTPELYRLRMARFQAMQQLAQATIECFAESDDAENRAAHAGHVKLALKELATYRPDVNYRTGPFRPKRPKAPTMTPKKPRKPKSLLPKLPKLPSVG